MEWFKYGGNLYEILILFRTNPKSSISKRGGGGGKEKLNLDNKIGIWIYNVYDPKQLSHVKMASAPFCQEQSNIMSWATPCTQIGVTL